METGIPGHHKVTDSEEVKGKLKYRGDRVNSQVRFSKEPIVNRGIKEGYPGKNELVKKAKVTRKLVPEQQRSTGGVDGIPGQNSVEAGQTEYIEVAKRKRCIV